MSKVILYLLEVSTVLAILYSLYLLLLKNETFFSLNRFFLLFILGFSFLFPLLNFDLFPSKVAIIKQPIEQLSSIRASYYEALASWSYEGSNRTLNNQQVNTNTNMPTVAWNSKKMALTLLLTVYGIGLLAMIFRISWTFLWIIRLKSSNPKESIQGVVVVKLPHPIAPFSFMKYVFVYKDLIDSEEFDQILAHEKTHIKQRHSIDLLFVQLLAAGLWFNPVVWLLIKSLKTTHEYIADKKMIASGHSLVEYQSLLLRQLISNNSYGLVHNFNLSFIKKRITMMTIKESGWVGRAKVAITLSIATIFSLVIVQCNFKVDEQVSIKPISSSPVEYADDINVPILPSTTVTYNRDLSNALNLTIQDNKITINNVEVEIDKIASLVAEKSSESTIVVVVIDGKQSMALVRDVQLEFRNANRRKLLYLGKTTSGKQVEITFLLPPDPENTRSGLPQMPSFDLSKGTRKGDIVTLDKTEILMIDLGNQDGFANQNKVERFVKSHIERQSSDYVVSAKYKDDDTFNDYLLNLTFIQEAFNQIYDERAQKMFGKSFGEMNIERSNNEEVKKQYMAVRKGVPKAISIAD